MTDRDPRAPEACKRCCGARVDTYVDPDAPNGFTERPCPACAPEAERPAGETLVSALNQVLTILRDLDCPLDVRVTMVHDVAEAALSATHHRPTGEASHLQDEVERRDTAIVDLMQQVSARTSERDQAREAITTLEQFHTGEASHLRRLLAEWVAAFKGEEIEEGLWDLMDHTKAALSSTGEAAPPSVKPQCLAQHKDGTATCHLNRHHEGAHHGSFHVPWTDAECERKGEAAPSSASPAAPSENKG